ncbi:hypothetical protein EJ08DRAFT_299000 [Tothia fuscella]|uniref:DUF7580 domain-containing protein n=1 Tax=Tothia fuscella TaxID=1048955 RepID=A0A9P4NNU8_9PEZI|nr:hypothetical protein EJ08DRAFT_299000 [Tothia fuscella]
MKSAASQNKIQLFQNPSNDKMSGAEVAGIALAIIPIAIKAIQEQRKICEPFLIAARPDVLNKELITLYRDVHYEVTRLESTMARLSREVYVPWTTEREVQAIATPQALESWEWRDTAIRHRLNTTNDAFQESTQALVKALAELTSDDTLDIQGKEKITSNAMISKLKALRSQTVSQRKTFTGMRKRFRFWAREAHRRDKLLQIATFNTRLDTLLNISTYTIPDLNQIDNLRNIHKIEISHSQRALNLRGRRCLAVKSAYNLLHSGDVASSTTPGLDLTRLHPNPSVLMFAILLLELETGIPLDEQRTSEDLDTEGLQDSNSDYFTAERVYHQAKDDIYTDYRSAIEACLLAGWMTNSYRVQSDAKLANDRVYQQIVVPLERDLYEGFGLRVGDLAKEKFPKSRM